MKFGGTSVGSAQRMKGVATLINDGEDKIVVLSAMSGTTNSLVEICGYLANNNPEGANEVIGKLENLYKKHINELYDTAFSRGTTARSVSLSWGAREVCLHASGEGERVIAPEPW